MDQDVVALASNDAKNNGSLPKPQEDAEIGYDKHLPYVMPYENSWEVLNRDGGPTVLQLSAMLRTDGQAKALYRLLTFPIRAALKNATFQPGPLQKGGKKEAKFAEQLLTLPAVAGGMETPFNKVIAQLLLAVVLGYSGFELVYHVPVNGPLKGKWALKKIAHRPSETITFLTDNKGGFAGFRQKCMHHGMLIDEKIPKDTAVYYSCNEEENALYGRSYFEAAFSHYDKKARLYFIAHLAAQRAAVGTRIGKGPAGGSGNPKELSAFKKALADLGVAQWIYAPDGYTVESLKEGGSFDFLAFVNHHSNQMSKSILAPFFDKDQGSGQGEAKVVDFGEQSNTLFLLQLETIMGEIEDVVNSQILPRFIDWNFGSGLYPKFKFGPLTEDEKTAVIELFTKFGSLSEQSLSATPEFVRELEKQVADEFGLEIDYESIEAEEERIAKEMEQESLVLQQEDVSSEDEGVPSELLPDGFQLSNLQDDDVLKLAGDLLIEAASEVLDQDDLVALVRYVRTPDGAQRFGVPVGSAITRRMREEAAQRAGKKKPASTGEAPSGQVTAQKPGKAPEGETVRQRRISSGESGPTSVVRRVWQNPKAPGYSVVEFADGTVALRRPDGTVGKRNSIDVSKLEWEQLGWVISQKEE